ncbi:MAG: apolipoprotein N-acyltransferase [Acidobacteria bacterium]|nr:apolipoprotein N-acyltransferase [Acidobacteriota bacterium]
MTRVRAACALAALGGVVNGSCWLPIGVAPVAPLFVVLFLQALRRVRTGREALAVGLCFGTVRYAVAGHFILSLVRFSPLAIGVFLVYVAYIVPFALLEAWGPLALERRTGFSRALGASLLFPLLEWVRSVGDLSFPADQLAHDFAPHPAWLGFEPWLGPFAVTFLVCLVGLVLDRAWESRRERTRAAVLAASAVVLWSSPVVTSWLAGAKLPSAGGEFRVGLVQPAVGAREKLDRACWPRTWERLRELSTAAAAGTDLVLWPETARPGPVVWRATEPFADREVEAISREIDRPILYGCQIARIERDGAAERVSLFNGAATVHPDGRPAQWYGKQRLLPFVEGVPFGRYLGWDPSRRASRRGDQSALRLFGNFSAGPGPTVFEVGPARIGVLICYEGVYPQLARRYRQAGANILAVLTDDAWWGGTVFPRWHATMVATRALETGLPVVRAANDGVCSHTDRTGTLRENSRRGPALVQHARVSLGSGAPTAYARHGDAIVGLGWVLLATGIATRLARRSWCRAREQGSRVTAAPRA